VFAFYPNDSFAQREPTEIISKTDDPKIDSTILEWMTSSNPSSFAAENDLVFSNNKIQVYVFLDTSESISNIPQDIDVLASDDNIVVVLVSSDQINQLSQLEFVEKISPPIKARYPPIPIIQESTENDRLCWIILGIGLGISVVLIVSISYMKKKEIRNKTKGGS